MPKHHFIRHLIIIALLLVLFGCSPSTKITSSWVQQPPPAASINKILIIALSRDTTSRKLWENSFAEQFVRRNTQAIASHTITEEPIAPQEEAILQIIQQAGADTVLITHLIDSETTTKWHPGTVHYEPSFYSGMYGYYGHAYQAVYSPPTVTTRTVVSLESNMYDVSTKKLVWAAQSATINPKLLKTDFDSVVKVLLADLQKKGVLH
ncbi:hypothetical protein [Desulfogranum marinum]|uniref:hypothetical protein n=1 Tax=Desulfogranum marinum TaxID=453220 RepID=UPI0019644887|nr:hypothetical protein [Desulfogranum marinum]MBM9513062.1 hypothetical protein [Desulfogranum marinum]